LPPSPGAPSASSPVGHETRTRGTRAPDTERTRRLLARPHMGPTETRRLASRRHVVKGTGTSLLVTGGARSGKTRYALDRALAHQPPRAYVATATPGDAEMAARIAAHRGERGDAFMTIEEPRALARALERVAPAAGVAVLDCLTLWIANVLDEYSDRELRSAVEELAGIVASRPFAVIIVSNEVGSGIVPFDPRVRRFRDLLGFANQQVAAAVDRVVLMVAGLPVVVKPQR